MTNGRNPPLNLTSNCGVWTTSSSLSICFLSPLFVCNLGHVVLLVHVHVLKLPTKFEANKTISELLLACSLLEPQYLVKGNLGALLISCGSNKWSHGYSSMT